MSESNMAIRDLRGSAPAIYHPNRGIAEPGISRGFPKSGMMKMKAIDSRSPVDRCLRFRLQDEDQWRIGRTVNISESGMLFSSLEQVEVGTILEVELLEQGTPLTGMVVRRVLMAWPDLTAQVAIKFLKDSVRTGDHESEQVAG